MANNWFFHYQVKGGEEDWVLDLSEKRSEITQKLRPAFTTVLDLSSVPDDGDWSRTKYRGDWYADFDADGDLELACEQFKLFLVKLDDVLGFDVSQARLYASGGKGFHIMIPQACFMSKPPPTGLPWLPYIYEHMAREVIVETMDMRVYSGKRGRMWRTEGVKRESGTFKVQLTVDEAFGIDPDSYRQIVSEARDPFEPTPPHCNSKFAMLFERAKDKVSAHMRGRKKRAEKANAILDPWKKSGKTPQSIQALMDGKVADGAGFQSLSMQLAIWATSVGIPLQEFVGRCQGLIENHVSDSRRYNTEGKRREELARMFRYMDENSFYEFDVGPIVKLSAPGVSVAELGVMDKTDADDDRESRPAASNPTDDHEPGEARKTDEDDDPNKGIRRGFFVNADGMWVTQGDNTHCVCRAVPRRVEAFYDVEKNEFRGYEFDIYVRGRKLGRAMIASETLTSAANLRKYFAAHQLSFQAGDYEAMALLDVLAEKAGRNGRTYAYHREGLTVLDHPTHEDKKPVMVYLTQERYICSEAEDSEDYFKLRYKPLQAMSAYNIDIHRAPKLDESMIPVLHDLFRFSRPDVVADLLGWFIACHWHSAYHYLFRQFPLLQIYGEAGAGKTQTMIVLSRLHWYLTPFEIKSATSFTPFTLDMHASTSSSAPLIIDEYKPRELRKKGNMYEKLKDVLKATYVGGSIGERGTVNKGGESTLSVVRSQASAPIAFMGEAIEMETAIIERSISVNLSKALHNEARSAAFRNLEENPQVLSALGLEILEMGFTIDLNEMRSQVRAIQSDIDKSMPTADDPTRRKVAPRMIFNRAVVIHALRSLRAILARNFGNEFDKDIDMLLGVRSTTLTSDDDKLVQIHAMSEMSKVLARASILSRAKDQPWELKPEADYIVGEGWVEIRIDRVYDQYRRYCAVVSDPPLFDNLDAFVHALNAYSPCIDRICSTSELRSVDETSKIVRLDSKHLTKEGVQPFRT